MRSWERTIRAHGIEVLYHAAAHKHVPLVEANVLEGIRNNVFGTLTLAETAAAENVQSFVLISSDKAVRPTNVMGATKRWAELIVRQLAIQARSSGSKQTFCAVRFGNVIGSNGSVVPLFKETDRQGWSGHRHRSGYDPLLHVHPGSSRTDRAGRRHVGGGDVLPARHGCEPVRIGDLAENMIRLAASKSGMLTTLKAELRSRLSARRPGEKPFEELFYNRDHAKPTAHPKIMRADSGTIARYYIDTWLANLEKALTARMKRRPGHFCLH